MAGNTPPKIGLPVIGEGQLELPWMTQIELLSFSWDIEVQARRRGRQGPGSLLGAAAGMAAGAVGGNLAGAVGGQAGLAVAAAAAAAACRHQGFPEDPA